MRHITVSYQSQFCFITIGDVNKKGVSAMCDAVCKHVHDAFAYGYMVRIVIAVKGDLHLGALRMLGQDLAGRFDPFLLMQKLRISADNAAKRCVATEMMKSIATRFARQVLEGDFILDLKALRIDKDHSV